MAPKEKCGVPGAGHKDSEQVMDLLPQYFGLLDLPSICRPQATSLHGLVWTLVDLESCGKAHADVFCSFPSFAEHCALNICLFKCVCGHTHARACLTK